MKCGVTRLRVEGLEQKRFESCMFSPIEGEFVAREEWSEHHGRHVIVARCADLPPLYDARLLGWNATEAVLTGIELSFFLPGFRPVAYAQTWTVIFAPQEATQTAQAAPAPG